MLVPAPISTGDYTSVTLAIPNFTPTGSPWSLKNAEPFETPVEAKRKKLRLRK
jgi:hypothetical protein